MAGEIDFSQMFALIVGDTPLPPKEMDLAASVVEYWFDLGPPKEMDLAASVVEYWFFPAPSPLAMFTSEPAAQGYVGGPRWQQSGGP